MSLLSKLIGKGSTPEETIREAPCCGNCAFRNFFDSRSRCYNSKDGRMVVKQYQVCNFHAWDEATRKVKWNEDGKGEKDA